VGKVNNILGKTFFIIFKRCLTSIQTDFILIIHTKIHLASRRVLKATDAFLLPSQMLVWFKIEKLVGVTSVSSSHKAKCNKLKGLNYEGGCLRVCFGTKVLRQCVVFRREREKEKVRCKVQLCVIQLHPPCKM